MLYLKKLDQCNGERQKNWTNAMGKDRRDFEIFANWEVGEFKTNSNCSITSSNREPGLFTNSSKGSTMYRGSTMAMEVKLRYFHCRGSAVVVRWYYHSTACRWFGGVLRKIRNIYIYIISWAEPTVWLLQLKIGWDNAVFFLDVIIFLVVVLCATQCNSIL